MLLGWSVGCGGRFGVLEPAEDSFEGHWGEVCGEGRRGAQEVPSGPDRGCGLCCYLTNSEFNLRNFDQIFIERVVHLDIRISCHLLYPINEVNVSGAWLKVANGDHPVREVIEFLVSLEVLLANPTVHHGLVVESELRILLKLDLLYRLHKQVGQGYAVEPLVSAHL